MVQERHPAVPPAAAAAGTPAIASGAVQAGTPGAGASRVGNSGGTDLRRVLAAAQALQSERTLARFAAAATRHLADLLGGGMQATFCIVWSDRPAIQAVTGTTGATPLGPTGEDARIRLLATTDPVLRAGPSDPMLADLRAAVLAAVAGAVPDSAVSDRAWSAHVLGSGRELRGVVLISRPTGEGDPVPEAERSVILAAFLPFVDSGFETVLLVEHLVQDRTHDRATGLLNRTGFVAAIDARLRRLADEGRGVCAVATIDLRRFRDVNLELGLASGDRLLVATGERLAAVAGGPDFCARIGGDQFALLFPAMAVEIARGKLREIAAALCAPIMLAGREVHPLAIPGLAWCRAEDPDTTLPDAEAMLAGAEEAMQQAKRSFGRMAEVMVGRREETGRLGLTMELNAALKQNQFELYYQPIVAAGDRRVVAFEALVRWNHPVRGLIAPAAFIPTAEETGLIVPIGTWALREAAMQTAAWHRDTGHHPWVSINISAAQLSEPGFLENVKTVITESGVDPTFLKLEVTESTVIADADHAVGILLGLRDLGIRLCMDDFGTGYSNLGYLQTLPFDFLKIDRAFVRTMIDRFESRTILRTMLALAQQLGIEVVAEGVESPDQADELHRLGCGFLQGYLFGHPLPAADAGTRIGGG
ncbi:MAG: hypothetical protein RLY86_575 [Pseudomonadota bacterium]|jgi:diguanylate cyclase (GGDEF)-like protein